MKLYWKVKNDNQWKWVPAEIGYLTLSDWITVLSPEGAGIRCQCSQCIHLEEEK